VIGHARLSRAGILASLALAILLREAPAAAQPVAPQPADARIAEAKAHFDKGVELMQQREWGAALDELMRSRELYPKETTLTNAAICLRELGRDDEALDVLEALLRDFPNLPARKRPEVEREVSALQANVGSIEIQGGEPGAAIEIDGRERGVLPVAGPVHVKAGSRVVRARKDGYSPAWVNVDVPAGQTVRVVLELHELPAPPDMRPALPPIMLPSPTPFAPQAPQRDGSYLPGAILLGVGGAGLVVGAVTGAVSLVKASHVKSQCTNDVCPTSTLGEANASRAIGNVSTATFIGGGVVAAAGVVLLVIRPRIGSETSAPARAFQWDTRIGLGHVELGGRF
jgi:hypothetical protein